ncbi:MAG: ribonucleoside-diphosphate reductase subunit alpha [Chlamydiota bacterium]
MIYRDHHKLLREDSVENIKVIRREDESPVRFNPMKIACTIEKAFRLFHEIEGPTPEEIIDIVNQLTEKALQNTQDFCKDQKQIDILQIQDIIEMTLMSSGYFNVAKEYILTRARLGKQSIKVSKELEKKKTPDIQRKFQVMQKNGNVISITEADIRKHMQFICRDLETLVSSEELLESTIVNFYDGMKEEEMDTSHLMATRSKIEKEPAYSQVTARLLLDTLYRESVGVKTSHSQLKKKHTEHFQWYIKHGITIDRIGKELLQFDLEELGNYMDLKRDDLFSYLGLQTLYDRYFIHENQRRLETPQIFWMRVAMGLSLREDNPTKRAKEFYDLLSQFHYVSATPTLFNSGTAHSQLSSCYLSTVMDDLHHIFKVVADDAQLSKWAGGIGNDWTNVRATGSVIKGTNGQSQGVIPFLKVANDTAVAVNQCFAPDTSIYTNQGIKPISEMKVGDLVLGVSGNYREVKTVFAYNQHGPMVSLDVKHSVKPLEVTSGHPFYVIQGIPMNQSIERTMEWITKGKVKCAWVEAEHLQKGDYIAQVIPQEVVKVAELDEDDAHLYGILLGDGHRSNNSQEWGISGNPQNDTHLEFVREYLRSRGIHFWETGRAESYVQIRFATGLGATRDGATGRIIGSVGPTLPFEESDIYNEAGEKHIAPRLAHLPRAQTLALIQGLIETDGHISREKEISFTNTSLPLIEGLRYQLLRLEIPTAGNYRVRDNDHIGTRSDGSKAHFKGQTKAYDLRIPATEEIAKKVGCKKLTKKNWITLGKHLFTRIVDVKPIASTPFVYDLEVEGDESYMTTAALAHNGGKRKGAMCAYLETWHLDIEDFLELRKNTGDERRRTHDMNTANWIPDLFMKRVINKQSWTLFSPSDTPDLHDLYGAAFEKRYVEYETLAEQGILKLHKKVEALDLWRKMLSMLFETGHPWITFKDPSNIRSPQDHMGVVHSSNLCTEILLNTSATETAVCNLGSINLVAHVTKDGIDENKLAATIKTAVRMLDNVIDINFYPIIEAKNSNLQHRPIGLGIMGFQDALYVQRLSYASHEAVAFADKCQEVISYYALLTSSELAKERGCYPSYKGSKWDRGLLPIDTIELLEQERGELLDLDKSSSMDWSIVRNSIQNYGMRNSNVMAIAPTATIANIIGISASIEPYYKHLYVKSNLSGEFTTINNYLINDLKALNLWDDQMVDDLKYFDGSIQEIDRIPEELKKIYLTAFEIDPDWIIECGARRQKWIDMGQSLNLYLAEANGKKLDSMYKTAWKKGVKTTYYLRSLAATQIEKSTTDINKRSLQPRWMKHASPSSRIVVDRDEAAPIACTLGEGCESCQ